MNTRELATWDMFFAGIVSIRFHPKNVESLVNVDPEFQQRIVSKCAAVADLMMVEHRKRDAVAYKDVSGGV